MRHIIIYYKISLLLALFVALPSFSQTKKTSARKTNRTAQTKKSTNRKRSAAASKNQKNAVTYSNASIRKLQSQRAEIQKKIKEQEKALQENKANVSKKLNELMMINGDIDKNQQNINNIEKDIHHINGNISILNTQLNTLKAQLKDRQNKYIKSMRYMARHRTVQDKLMFIFSAKNLYQMYRRLRFVREYANYQKAQGEAVKAKQQQVTNKHKQLQNVKGQKNNLLYKGQQEHAKLEANKNQQQEIVNGLQKQQGTIRVLIAEQRKKDAALNAEIDRQVEIEVAKVRARAEAEARRQAAAIAAARQRRAAELARKKAAAEAAARENARRIAEAKARELAAEQAAQQAREAAIAAQKAREAAAAAEEKRKAQAAAEAAAARKAAAEQAAREAEAAREAAERKQAADAERAKKEIAEAKQDQEDVQQFSSVDRMMNNGFEANRGRLPMPITGNYRIVSHFGQYNVAGLKGVTLDNKGINIMGGAGAKARAIYDGEVSAVLSYAGTVVVMLRHGAYISVYSNLSSASVSRGQHVSTRQVLGTVGPDHILQFQLRKERAKLNPEAWLGR
jgi:septal ring factor EnvC (AmiA/AmiB activator)